MITIVDALARMGDSLDCMNSRFDVLAGQLGTVRADIAEMRSTLSIHQTRATEETTS
jgi:hypothetical protein